MNHRKDADRFVKALADFLEEPALALNDGGACSLELEGFQTAFFYTPDPETLYIQIAVGDMAEAADKAAVLENLLEANYLWQATGGGVIGLSPDDDRIYLSYALPLPVRGEENQAADDDFLLDFLPHLIGAAEAARDFLEGPETGQTQTAGGVNPAAMA